MTLTLQDCEVVTKALAENVTERIGWKLYPFDPSCSRRAENTRRRKGSGRETTVRTTGFYGKRVQISLDAENENDDVLAEAQVQSPQFDTSLPADTSALPSPVPHADATPFALDNSPVMDMDSASPGRKRLEFSEEDSRRMPPPSTPAAPATPMVSNVVPSSISKTQVRPSRRHVQKTVKTPKPREKAKPKPIHKKTVYMLDKAPPANATPDRRRSARTKFKPLEYWRNEQVVYDDKPKSSANPEIVGLVLRSPEATPFKRRTKKEKVEISPEKVSRGSIVTPGLALRTKTARPYKPAVDHDAGSGKKKATATATSTSPKSPARSPAKSPARSPAQSPARSLAKSPARSPAKSPAKSPSKSPAKSTAKSAAPKSSTPKKSSASAKAASRAPSSKKSSARKRAHEEDEEEVVVRRGTRRRTVFDS